MALTPNFSTSQTLGNPSVINISDDSTGSDAAISARRVYLVDAQGNYVVPDNVATDYVTWAYADTTTTIDCLDEDMALTITVLWVNSGGTTLYSKTILCSFTLYNETFYYSLTQAEGTQSTPPNIIQDNQYLMNKFALRNYIDSGNQAVTYGSDVTSAQNMYDAATYMVQNEGDYF